MTQIIKHEAERDALRAKLGTRQQDLIKAIAEHDAAVNEAQRRAGIAADRGTSDQVRAANADLSKHQAVIRDAQHELKTVQLEIDAINSGNHPALAGTLMAAQMAHASKQQAEIDEAKAAYMKHITPELHAAAQHYVKLMHSVQQNPGDVARLLAQ